MKKKFYLLTTFILISLFLGEKSVWAENLVNYPEKIEIETTDKPSSTRIESNYNFNGYYHTVSPIYEFFDENNIYNIVYVSGIKSFNSPDDNNLIVHWLKIKDNMITSDIILPTNENFFGNAIYKNGNLYVVYGNSALYKDDSKNIETVVFTKYDATGKVLGELRIKGQDASNNFVTESQAGTRVPFSYANPANCDVALKDNILVTFFGRLSYGIHQASLFLAVDTDTMSLKTDGIWTYLNRNIYASHSMDERIIVDSEGNIITIDMGDAAYTRGFSINKTKFTDENSGYLYKFVPFNFRESASVGYYYNNTYASMGNMIEVDDGYIIVNASDKILSKAFLNSSYGSPWNVFVQKYKKHFEDVKTDSQTYALGASEEEHKNMQMLTDEEVRYNVGERDTTDISKIHLFTDQNNYGVRWLTDFDTDNTIDIIRAVKIDNDRVFIMYEKTPIRHDNSVVALTKLSEIYYMVIDKDTNVIIKPVRVFNVDMSTNIHYQYKDGYIYWTTTTGSNNKITLNKLKIDDYKDIGDINFNKIEISGYSRVSKNGTVTLEVAYYPAEANQKREVTWSSSDSEIATVDKYGNVKGIKGGKVTITATTSNNISANHTIYVNSKIINTTDVTITMNETFKLEYLERFDYEEIPLEKITYESADTNVVTVDNNGLITPVGVGETTIKSKIYNSVDKTIKVKVIDYKKGDMNKNGKIDLQDIIILLKKYLGSLTVTDEDKTIGDMDNNGSIGLKDIILLLRSYLGTN